MASKEDKGSQREQRNTGQVRHDDRGNAVWHWAADTARTAMASTSQLLRKLDLSNLSLETDQHNQDEEPGIAPGRPAAKPGGHPAARASGAKRTVDTRTGGFDPYSSNAGTSRRPVRATAAPPRANRQPVALESRRSWWQRLLRRD